MYVIMEIEIPYNLDLRPYQLKQYQVMDSGIKRVVKIWHRRAGKDLTDLNYMIKEAVQIPNVYWYVLPELQQARKAIWEGRTKDGRAYLSYIPQCLIKRQNNQEMVIELVNGSIIRLIGGDRVDKIVGAGPRGIVMSEYSLQRPSNWQLLEPMILEKDGWAIFNGTPRGNNHFYDLKMMAENNPRWFVQICTVDDTGVITEEQINQLREEGRPEEIIQQEYYCSFAGSIHGAYYGKLMDAAEQDGRILNDLVYDPNLPVHTFWDLGVGDATAIWFVQVASNQVRLIDYYEQSGEGLQHYINYLSSKPYVYGEHYAPHDIEVRELGTGKSRLEIALSLGLRFNVIKRLSVDDGIQAVRSLLPRCWFIKEKTKPGREALKQYRKEYDDKRACFKDKPLHDWTSHGADAFRYLAIGIDKIIGRIAVNYKDLYN